MGYLEERYSYVRGDHLESFYRFKARRILAEVSRFAGRQIHSFLDIGCACGDLLAGMNHCGVTSVSGIEPDAGMVLRARESGLTGVREGKISDRLHEFRGSFELIGTFEVLEHLAHAEHKDAFEALRYYSKPGGIGVVIVPNAAHPLLGGWLSWSDYTHRSCFTAESLAQYLRTQGVVRACVVPWYNASGSVLLSVRRGFGVVLGGVFKLAVGLINTVPRGNDPFVKDPLPMSTHLMAIFDLPD